MANLLRAFWSRGGLLALLLAVVTVVAYQPAWNGEPVFDDEDHLTPPELRSLSGLVRIWTQLGVVSQYYPLAHSAFWVEHQLWGDAMLGYHLANIILHIFAALLLLRILKHLEVPGAWLAAALFALHPVHVESVAWISELKNTLSGVFYLGSALAYLTFDRTRGKSFYAIALVLFIAGLLSKTVVASLPAALLVVFWWKRGTLSWKRDAQPLLPFFLSGVAMGLLTVWMERTFIGAEGAAFDITLIQRFLIAGRVIWFYLGKLSWPADLIFIYPRWQVSEAVWWQYLFVAAVLLLLAGLWALRHRWRGPLAALLFFVGTLFPALGFINVYPFRYSFVADHYQYLASIGIITAAAAGVALALRRWQCWGRPVGNLLCLTLLAAMAVLTWRQSHMYTDIETLWRTTIARNPGCFVAHSNLGNLLLERGQVDEAIRHCKKALELQSGFAEIHNNLGSAFRRRGQVDEAILQFKRALEIRPDLAVAHCNLGSVLQQSGRADEAMSHFQKAVEIRPEFVQGRENLANALLQKGRVDEAIVHVRAALEIRPDEPNSHNTLGSALVKKGQVDEALAHFQKAVEIQPDFPVAYFNSGNVFFQKQRVDEAVAQFQRALQARPDFAEAHFNLGGIFLQKGRADEAISHLQAAVKSSPGFAEAYYQLGHIFAQRGRQDEAIVQFKKALEIKPGWTEAYGQLGNILFQRGRADEAIANLQKAVESRPDSAEANHNLGWTLLQAGRVDEAISHFQVALKIEPDVAVARNNLAVALLRKGRARDAVAEFYASLKLEPDNASVLSDLAWILGTWPDTAVRNGAEAIELAQRANKLSGGQDPMALRTLAAAYAEGGRFNEAVVAAQRALRLAETRYKATLANALQSQIELYRAESPLRDSGPLGALPDPGHP